MTDQVIPEAAVEAAVEAHCEGTMRAALEAALSYILTDGDTVERAAKAQYEHDVITWDDGTEPDWECEGRQQEVYRKGARVALNAALGWSGEDS